MSELGNCPKCGSNNIELDGRPSAGMGWFYAQCECGFKTIGAFTKAKAIRELQMTREVIEAFHGNSLLKKVMQLPVMQQCLISLKQGQGVDLDEGKTLIQAFVATGMAKQEDFE